MALAILTFQDQGDTHCRFAIDLGVNRFYCYRIGSGKSQSSHGLPQLSQTQFTSELFGPLLDSSLGRTILEVPIQQFNLRHRCIQLISFRTADRIGPAISEIVEIPPLAPTAFALTFSPATAMNSRPVETVPFRYQETQPYSSPMFLGALLKVAQAVAGPVLQTIAKVAAPIVTPIASKVADQVIPGSGKVLTGIVNTLIGTPTPNSSASPASPPPPPKPDLAQLQTLLTDPQITQKLGVSPEIAKLLGTTLQQLLASTTAPAAAPAQSGAMAFRSASPVALLDRPPVATALSHAPYTEAMAVPTVLAMAVPQLMPLLQKVYTPETVQMLLQSMPPQQAIGAITHGLIDVSNSYPDGTGAAAARSVAQALAQPDRTSPLVHGLSLGLATADVALEFQRVDSVQLRFADTTTLMMGGRSRLLYRADQTLALPLTVATPRPISKGIVQMLVKHPQTLEVLIAEKYRLQNITSGGLAVVPSLSPERLRSLPPNQDYLVCINLIWQATSSKTQQKKRLGTSISQLMTLVGEYSFDRVEGTTEVVPLNDVDRFRDYWHKVWEQSFADPLQQMKLDCKYYLTLEPERTDNARMETVTQFDDTIPIRLEGKLKTGLLMSPYRLNELIPQISTHPSLSTAELAALMTPEFQQQCSYAARSAVEFKGKRGDTVGLWVYPELKLQRIVLKQAGQTNANGQVLTLTDHDVYFPVPAIVHFIGVGS